MYINLLLVKAAEVHVRLNHLLIEWLPAIERLFSGGLPKMTPPNKG